MPFYDLRPLSIGEILDRSFSLYRQRFTLFTGIVVLVTIPSLLTGLLESTTTGVAPASAWRIAWSLLNLIVSIFTLLAAQAATVFAISETYLGRETTITACLVRMRGELGAIFGVMMLSGLAIGAGLIALVLPGIWLISRLSVVVPATLIEQRGAREALSRSFDLTKGFAWRAFLIFFLYYILSTSSGAILVIPLFAAGEAAKTPEFLRWYGIAAHFYGYVSNALLMPLMLIATSVFYYDLRVRKEAFDLQFQLDPESEGNTAQSSFPSILG